VAPATGKNWSFIENSIREARSISQVDRFEPGAISNGLNRRKHGDTPITPIPKKPFRALCVVLWVISLFSILAD